MANTKITTNVIADGAITSAKLDTNITISGNITGTLATAAQPNITSLGTLSALTVDDITINGSTISDAGDLTLDVGGDINLDADGADINLKDAGTAMGRLGLENGDLNIASSQQDYDIKFKGNDGGSIITALTFDMSDAGTAIFNNNLVIPASIYHTGDTNTFFGFQSADTFTVNTAGSERMRIDSSGNVGIGIASPTEMLHINKTSGTGSFIRFQDTGGSGVYIGGRAEVMEMYTNGSEKMRIQSDGKVGIGTSSPQTSTKGLHVVHDATEGTPSFPSGEVIIAQRNFNSSQGCHIGIIGGSAGDSAINFGDKDNSDAGIIRYHHNGDFLGFTTNTTEHWKMLANGSFQPTQQHTKDIGGVNAEVRNIYAQGLYVGGSGSANKLDDYEEGTWTPVLTTTGGSTATHSDQVGQYTKIGNMVHVHGTIRTSSGADASGTTIISGLPFTSLNSGGMRNVGSMGAMNGCGTAAENLRLVCDPNKTFIYVIKQTGQSYDHYAGMNSAVDIYGFSLVYSSV